MELSFERLGWIRCAWSGFHFYLDRQMDDLGPGAMGWHYASGAIVLGFWVYQFRVWVSPQKDATP